MLTTPNIFRAGLISIAILLAGCSGGDESPDPDMGEGPPITPEPPEPPPPPPPPPSGEYHGVDPEGSYDVRITREITYTTGLVNLTNPQPMDLLLDLFEPDVDLTGGNVPAVVVIHGGGFKKGSRNHGQMQAFAEEFARRGFIAVSIDYRLIPDDPALRPSFQDALDDLGIPSSQQTFARAQLAAVEDTLQAIDWIKEVASGNDFGIAGFGLLGESAGAVTSINLAYALDDLGLEVPEIGAVVGLWGTIGLSYDPAASVVTVDEAPIIMIHGTADTVVNYETGSLRIANRAEAIGLPYELISNVGAGHSFYDNHVFEFETSPGSGVTQAERVMDFVSIALMAPDCLREQGVIDSCGIP